MAQYVARRQTETLPGLGELGYDAYHGPAVVMVAAANEQAAREAAAQMMSVPVHEVTVELLQYPG